MMRVSIVAVYLGFVWFCMTLVCLQSRGNPSQQPAAFARVFTTGCSSFWRGNKKCIGGKSGSVSACVCFEKWQVNHRC